MEVEEFFSLKEEAWSVQPDPRFAYPSVAHQYAIAKLDYGVKRKKGLATLLGPIGAGKTTIANQLLAAWSEDETLTVGFLSSANERTAAQFLRSVLQVFKQEPTRNAQDNERLLQSFLLLEAERGHHPVLMIDEGQDISSENIDTIARMYNFQTAKSKLITVVIFAQDNFPNKLSRKPSFQSRIAVPITIDLLDFNDMCQMIAHRLATAGGGPLADYFDEPSLHEIYDTTKGTPRDICVLCDTCFLNGYIGSQKRMDAALVQKTVAELAKSKGWPLQAEKQARKPGGNKA